ncbi:MAG: hypothetical protein WAO28_03315 [Candidatus Microsaccharimonas sp.]
MADLEQAGKNREEIAEIKRRYAFGEITRDEAKELAQPIIDRINERTVSVTKKLNQKYKVYRKPALLDFISLMR